LNDRFNLSTREAADNTLLGGRLQRCDLVENWDAERQF
jgi:hypothetical protein